MFCDVFLFHIWQVRGWHEGHHTGLPDMSATRESWCVGAMLVQEIIGNLHPIPGLFVPVPVPIPVPVLVPIPVPVSVSVRVPGSSQGVDYSNSDSSRGILKTMHDEMTKARHCADLYLSLIHI